MSNNPYPPSHKSSDKDEQGKAKSETAASKQAAAETAASSTHTTRVVANGTVLYRGTARRAGEEFDMLNVDLSESRSTGKVRLPSEPVPVAQEPVDELTEPETVPKDLPKLKDGLVYVRAVKTLLHKGSARGKGEVFSLETVEAERRKGRGEVKILT